MNFENYTERSRGFVQSAQTLALRSNHQRFQPEHILKVLLDDKEGLAAGLIRAAGGDPTGFCHACFSGAYPTPTPDQPAETDGERAAPSPPLFPVAHG